MPIKSRVTLIADPCGIPFCIMVGLERCPLILTWMCLFFRKFFMKASMFSFISSATRVFMILFLIFFVSCRMLFRCLDIL